MKRLRRLNKIAIRFTLLVLIMVLVSSFNNVRKKDCNPLILLDEAVKKMKKFTLIKDYPFNFREKKKKDGIEYLKQMITLNRGVRYKFLAIPNKEFEGKPIVSIYLSEKTDIIVATSYNTKTKAFYDEIEFECKTTGNYCLSFCFQDGLEGCAVGVHAFLK